jgi:hypothetical protein
MTASCKTIAIVISACLLITALTALGYLVFDFGSGLLTISCCLLAGVVFAVALMMAGR